MVSRRIVLKFPHRLVDQPIVYRMVKDFDLEFNILKAYVTPREEGLLVLEFTGDEANLEKAVKHARSLGVTVQPLSKDIKRNEAKCTHCGACVPICPTAALVTDPVTRKVLFYEDKCIACELCIKACPPRAMELHF
ncbi:MAG: NIL domain-containing protein [Candidatus Omnitrophota bacterium]